MAYYQDKPPVMAPPVQGMSQETSTFSSKPFSPSFDGCFEILCATVFKVDDAAFLSTGLLIFYYCSVHVV